jgi:hypothetical protein
MIPAQSPPAIGLCISRRDHAPGSALASRAPPLPVCASMGGRGRYRDRGAGASQFSSPIYLVAGLTTPAHCAAPRNIRTGERIVSLIF